MWFVCMLSESIRYWVIFHMKREEFLSLIIDNLLATHQWYILWKSYLAWIITSFKFSPVDKKDVSSANNLAALHPTDMYKSSMYND